MTVESKRRDIALIVDDTADTLRMLTDALDHAGMTVMVALDGASALRIIDQVRPDIVLLDAVMPGIDGFETCRRLKGNSTLADVPVIFMTGLADTDDIVRGLEAGGVDYVTKPIAVLEMIARIRVHLANARMTQSARAALDVSGRFLLAATREGVIRWATPQAQSLLLGMSSLETSADGAARLPESAIHWLSTLSRELAPPKAAQLPPKLEGTDLRMFYLGQTSGGDLLLRLARDSSVALPDGLSATFGLTARESEVLSWLAKGKTNRDIAQILGLSPRTIDKHLEQIYAKLGVDNRTAAATIATRAD